jgi:hypothetical protein
MSDGSCPRGVIADSESHDSGQGNAGVLIGGPTVFFVIRGSTEVIFSTKVCVFTGSSFETQSRR